jgi:hypothetical protein
MRTVWIQRLFVLFVVGVLAGCAASAPPLQTVVLEGSPQWNAGEPPEKQDLTGHFAYTKILFADGTLIANGPTMDALSIQRQVRCWQRGLFPITRRA